MRVLILGAGGHAQVVADILLQRQNQAEDVSLLGYLDDNPKLAGKRPLGVPVLGPIAGLASISHDAVVIAIGDNRTRRRLYGILQYQGERFANACHPSAAIAPDVPVGPGSMVCAGVVVNPGAVIGANVVLNTGCTVDHHNRIGDHAHIAPGVHLGGDVTIGEGAFLGISATVIPGRAVGAWAMVGAGSVVTKDIADGATAVGVPARVVRAQSADPDPEEVGLSHPRGA